ncbi:MAG: peptide-methionine (S)-S-oxide reductase MsrA [Bacteroidales bacterium]|nr:peptide-methionine (S)-S-oxide reductase MsrA [Bacteroidales bacterium]
MKTIFLAGGCFWGAQHYLKQIRGVVETQTGFANGTSEGAVTYEQVYTDRTGYAEAVRVVYDETLLSLEKLLDLFFVSIDPVSVNRQGDDEGTRYRTGIYYIDPADAVVAREKLRVLQAGYSSPVAVELAPIEVFYPADEYHQDYLDKHPDGYCHLPTALFEYARKANHA